MTDPISDLLIRIKNAYMASHPTVELPFSKAKLAIGEVMVKEGYLKSVSMAQRKDHKNLLLELIYKDNGPVVTNIRQVSKPGIRVYSKASKIPRVLGGLGVSIISTPKGVMSSKEARKQNLGGEIICQIW